MFQNGDAQNDIQTAATYPGQCFRQGPFDRRDLRIVFDVGRQCKIYQYGVLHFGNDRSNERCLIAATEISNPLSAKRTRILPDLISGQPNAKPVDDRRLVLLPVRPFAHAFRGGITSA